MKERWRSIQTHKEEIWKALNGQDTVIVFDTETTGLVEDAKIIQFSAIKFAIDENKNLKELATMDMYINPEELLTSTITDKTGITNNMLRDKPNERLVYRDIFAFMESSNVWVGHNVGFDVKKLQGMARRCKYPLKVPPVVDTLAMARNLIPKDDAQLTACAIELKNDTSGNHRLATVTKYLFPNYVAQYHNSLEDTRATAKIFEKMIQMYDRLAPEEEKPLTKVKLRYGYYSVNRYKKSDHRIIVVLEDGRKPGTIYYDALNHFWSCLSDPQSKSYFESIDKADLEKQLLNNAWSNKRGATCMDDLVQNMREERKAFLASKRAEREENRVNNEDKVCCATTNSLSGNESFVEQDNDLSHDEDCGIELF